MALMSSPLFSASRRDLAPWACASPPWEKCDPPPLLGRQGVQGRPRSRRALLSRSRPWGHLAWRCSSQAQPCLPPHPPTPHACMQHEALQPPLPQSAPLLWCQACASSPTALQLVGRTTPPHTHTEQKGGGPAPAPPGPSDPGRVGVGGARFLSPICPDGWRGLPVITEAGSPWQAACRGGGGQSGRHSCTPALSRP